MENSYQVKVKLLCKSLESFMIIELLSVLPTFRQATLC